MLARCLRPGETNRRANRNRESSPLAAPSPVRSRRFSRAQSRLFPAVLLLAAGFTLLPLSSFAAAGSETPSPRRPFWLIATHRTPRTDFARTATDAGSSAALIAQIRFGSKALPFAQGVTAGPALGNLEIQFAASSPATPGHLRYRLFGFDQGWKETEKGNTVLYRRLPAGRYEFDVEPAENGSWKGRVVESVPITVLPPWWLTRWFRSVCIAFLIAVIFALHRLRVHDLLRDSKRLQGKVSQTRAELTLAVRTAGDAQEALKEQALKDGLTGLWNRRALFSMLEREVYRCQRDKVPVTLVMIDLDHFKKINDTHGHLAGDQVLREAAGRFLEVMRPYDFAGRYGGEEFLVVLPSCSPQNGLRRAEDFRCIIADRPVPTSVGLLSITCSVGVAACDGSMSLESLIHMADAALYSAKRRGRNCVCSGNAPPAAAPAAAPAARRA